MPMIIDRIESSRDWLSSTFKGCSCTWSSNLIIEHFVKKKLKWIFQSFYLSWRQLQFNLLFSMDMKLENNVMFLQLNHHSISLFLTIIKCLNSQINKIFFMERNSWSLFILSHSMHRKTDLHDLTMHMSWQLREGSLHLD